MLNASVPDIEEDKFKELAHAAKEYCPVSKASKAVPISLKITFG
jgi:osmotically inducible protein OsmC